MAGRFHLSVTLPGELVAVADFRDPIVARFHAIHRARSLGDPLEPGDLAAVLDWLDRNARQVAICARGECDHDP